MSEAHAALPPAAAARAASQLGLEWVSKLIPGPEAWHSMSQGLRRLTELIQGTCNLGDDPAWLLGVWYGVQDADANTSSLTPELQQLLLADLHSRLWFTYRRGFAPIGAAALSSDVGWGCTLRSGQMLMAEALSRSWWGRDARVPPAALGDAEQPDAAAAAAGLPVRHSQRQPSSGGGSSGSGDGSLGPEEQARLLRLFVDQPAAPFSIHSICAAGAAHGVVAGQWLGPWVLCKALAAAAAAALQQGQASAGQQQPALGLRVHVVCDPGGGAPSLQPSRLRQLFASSSSSTSSDGSQLPTLQQQQHQEQHQEQQQGLLLLVPLTLGVGRVNERYLPQLSAVLSFPQSVGIVGGRPGASLFFVGVQGSSVLYLDPHEVQDMPSLPADAGTFHCSTPRLMPLAAIDPSLAIGFVCADAGELDDLVSRLAALADVARGAPLMTLSEAQDEQPCCSQPPGAAAADAGGPGGSRDDWELV